MFYFLSNEKLICKLNIIGLWFLVNHLLQLTNQYLCSRPKGNENKQQYFESQTSLAIGLGESRNKCRLLGITNV